jgi:polyphosphate kinase
VRSIVGRFLEHSRVFWFRNGGSEEMYLGSADLMGRNLDRRVEILFPVLDPRLVRQVKTEVLDTCLEDTAKARIMQGDGAYLRARAPAGKTTLDCQAELIKRRQTASTRT